MANPVTINPTLTLAGQEAAFNADNTGIELIITHASFGRAHYDPTGNEVALVEPVGSKIPIAGGSRPTPYQLRTSVAWKEDVGQVPVGEIAWWAGDVLVFVWSKANGDIASYKTDGVTYVLFNDLAFAQVPAGSINIQINPGESVALAALSAHEGANNAHPQYALRSKFPDYQGHLWGDVDGTANSISLTLPAIVELTEYTKGNRFSFKATATNTGDTTINVEGVGEVQVLKTGGVPLSPGSIVAGGVYDVYYDGAKFQLTAGAGFASAEATDAEVIALTDTTSTSWLSLRRLIKALLSFARLDGATFTGDAKGLTPAQFDNDASFPTTAFAKRMGVEYSAFNFISATTVLTNLSIGGVVSAASATPINVTLPPTAGVPNGATVEVVSSSSGAVTLLASGADTLTDQRGNVVPVVLAIGDNAYFIKVSSEWRLRGGSMALKYAAVMTGQNWITPPQFDNTTKLSTTEFVKKSGTTLSGINIYNANATLPNSVAGSFIEFYGSIALQTLTLPLAASARSGDVITIFNYATVPVTIARQGAEVINCGATSSVNSLVLQPGDSLFLVAGSGWFVSGGTAANQFAGSFGASLGVSGHKKDPSGLIIQWGTASVVAGTVTTITFPIAFPTACVYVGMIPACSANTADRYLGMTGKSQTAWTVVSSGAVGSTPWMAIGY
ncbi:hypothetical protein [Pseudomonas sp. UMAB-40]|uniref:gp53-like domain-containing protein n=1 Tax=Pseudomonas sp. UMAB-40 TaxID=1365407 RepID=UPI001C56F834|nr:hypothetical protein [Pseudomonas sp. UMAB-40]